MKMGPFCKRGWLRIPPAARAEPPRAVGRKLRSGATVVYGAVPRTNPCLGEQTTWGRHQQEPSSSFRAPTVGSNGHAGGRIRSPDSMRYCRIPHVEVI